MLRLHGTRDSLLAARTAQWASGFASGIPANFGGIGAGAAAAELIELVHLAGGGGCAGHATTSS